MTREGGRRAAPRSCPPTNPPSPPQISAKLGGPPLKLVAITSAGRQVVAGTNYAVTLTAAPPNSTAAKAFDAVVFQPLPHTGQPLQLTSYTEK